MCSEFFLVFDNGVKVSLHVSLVTSYEGNMPSNTSSGFVSMSLTAASTGDEDWTINPSSRSHLLFDTLSKLVILNLVKELILVCII